MAAAGQHPHIHHSGIVPGVVHDDLLMVHDFRAVFGHQFLSGRGPMEPRGDQDADAGIGGHAAQAAQQDRHDDGRRDRAGMI